MRRLLNLIRDTLDFFRRRLLNLLRDALDFFRPLDWGEFGVLVRDEAGNMVPMDQAYMDDLKAGVHKDIEYFWVSKQAEAFATYGEAILRPQ